MGTLRRRCNKLTLFTRPSHWPRLLRRLLDLVGKQPIYISPSLTPAFILSIRERGLRKSRPRQCLSGIVLFMLATSTVCVIIMMKFYMMQIPSAMGQEVSPGLVRRLREYNIAINWLARLNVQIPSPSKILRVY